MDIQINKPKRLISLVLGATLVLTGTIGLPANALPADDALLKIQAWAADSTDPADEPLEADYDLIVSGVSAANLDAVNDAIAALDSVADEDEVQTVVALVKISNYGESTNYGRPDADDYEDALVDYSDALDLAEVNRAVYSATKLLTDETSEVQDVVDAVNEDLALDLIKDYNAGDEDLTVLIFELAGIEGVVTANLDEMLLVFAAASSSDSNTQAEVQELVDDEIARLAAMEIISRYDGDNEEPTKDDYEDAGVVGVTAGNLDSINALFEDISYTNSNTLEEIQAIVNAELARVAALARIAAYNGVSNAPALQTYIDAGVLRVDATNFQAINVLLAAITSANSDTLVEIQDVVDDQAVAQLVLTNYTGAGTALTLAQYSAAGITGVTATNLTKVNIAIAAATVDASNTAIELQTIVDGLNATAAYWTKRVSATEAKLYAKNIVGAGKVQFFLNGKEIAWVNATDAADPKLRAANGSYYLVRTVSLAAGKNVLEIKAKGVQVKRVVYSR